MMRITLMITLNGLLLFFASIVGYINPPHKTKLTLLKSAKPIFPPKTLYTPKTLDTHILGLISSFYPPVYIAKK
jgi:hypothetical protein